MESWQDCFGTEQAFSFGFDYHQRSEPVTADGVTFTLSSRLARRERFKCRLICEEVDGGLRLTLDYDAAVHSEGTMERLAEQLLSLVGDASARPDRPIAALDVLGEKERKDLLETFNDTDAPYPHDPIGNGADIDGVYAR